MTRFARAKGSKASNERIPEQATSWTDMKQQLLEKNKQAEEAKKKEEADKQRSKNYKAFLENVEEEQRKNSKWAEFPIEKPKKLQKTESNTSKPKVKKKKEKPNKTPVKQLKKSGVKRKLNDSESTEPASKKKKVDLSEEDKKKIEKKKLKKLRQLENKKQKKPPATKKNFKTHPRRKQRTERIFINGKTIDIAYVDGFPIKKEDAERIHQLRNQMISKGLPRSEIDIALKLERRKAEKAFAREKKKVCFNCRKSGHNLSECPNLGQELAQSSGTGICFKCGSTEHTHFECKVVRGQEFKFAQCFICHEQGHIARQCPDNARGLYPKGGACKVCGDVTHLKKDCPKYQAQQRQLEENVHLETIGDDNPDSLGTVEKVRKETKRTNKIIKF